MTHAELIDNGWFSGKCQCVGRPVIYRKSNTKIKAYWDIKEPRFILLRGNSELAHGPISMLDAAMATNNIS